MNLRIDVGTLDPTIKAPIAIAVTSTGAYIREKEMTVVAVIPEDLMKLLCSGVLQGDALIAAYLAATSYIDATDERMSQYVGWIHYAMTHKTTSKVTPVYLFEDYFALDRLNEVWGIMTGIRRVSN